MSKGNALTALKAKVKGLETELATKDAALFQARQSTAKVHQSLDLVAEEGRKALAMSKQAVEDLQSVNAELRDATEEVQEQRDRYKRLLKITAGVFATYVVLDTAFYLFLLWG